MVDEVKEVSEVAPVVTAEPIAPAPVADVAKPVAAEPVVVEAPAAKVVEKKKAGRPRKVAAAPVVETPKAAVPAVKKAVRKPVAAKVAPAVRKVAVKAAAKLPVAPVSAPVIKKTQKSAAAPLLRTATASRKDYLIMTDTTAITEKFQTAFKEAGEKAKAAFEKSQASFGDVGEFAKGNVEAFVESTKIFASGLQELGKGYVTEGKSAAETLTTEIKGFASIKSPTEFFEKQAALLRKQFDAAVAVNSKNSEAMLKLASEAFQPISNRVSIAVEKIKKAA